MSAKDILLGRKSNPLTAAYDAKKNDQSVTRAVLDPSQKILKPNPTMDEMIAKRDKKKKKRIGMKAGGVCRGMGSATRGGKYGKMG